MCLFVLAHVSARICARAPLVSVITVAILRAYLLFYPTFYAIIFDESEEGTFEVYLGSTNFGVIRKTVPGVPKLHNFQENKSDCVFCSFSSEFLFVGEKAPADCFKYENIP